MTGRTRFAGDVNIPRMLWGAILRSPNPHARIVAVDARVGLGGARREGGRYGNRRAWPVDGEGAPRYAGALLGPCPLRWGSGGGGGGGARTGGRPGLA